MPHFNLTVCTIKHMLLVLFPEKTPGVPPGAVESYSIESFLPEANIRFFPDFSKSTSAEDCHTMPQKAHNLREETHHIYWEYYIRFYRVMWCPTLCGGKHQQLSEKSETSSHHITAPGLNPSRLPAERPNHLRHCLEGGSF